VSLIEEAAKRLEQLRNSGIDLPDLPTERRAEPPAHARAAGERDAAFAVLETEAVTQRAAELPASERPIPAPPAEHRAPARTSKSVVLDLARLAAAGVVTPDAPRSQIADEFRVSKRPLIVNALGKSATRVERANMIMVTSAVPGEGKTFTATNLAMSIAMEIDSTVLLVDADVANPSLPDLLGVKESRGLMDVLTDPKAELANVLLRTNVDRLALLPAGRSHRRATEHLASDAMERLIDDLASRYPDRIVVFDAPPLLATTEARALATHMGQIVVVVEADRTTHSALKQALTLLEDCPVVMTMLNKAAGSHVGTYYGYYGQDA
jgi:exopolysaccharide/PEP-CTERM locus tyrosine autokinase